MPTTRTLIDTVFENAERTPHKRAYLYVHGDSASNDVITYAELCSQVCRTASLLSQRGGRGERALLIYQPGLEFVCTFLGCLYAGIVAVPIYPPRNNRSIERVRSVASDSDATIALTSANTFAGIERFLDGVPMLRALDWIVTDHDGCAVDVAPPERPLPDSLAFLQYTSGSTGRPKGVAVSHRNIVHNQEAIKKAFCHSAEDVVVGWLPVYHDMGLIGNVLQPLYTGASCVLMSPTSFVQKPVRWLQTISTHKATTSGGPNFAYDLCLKKIRDEDFSGIDLSSWKVAFCGAEPIREQTMRGFAHRFEPYGFRAESLYPCYGMAEATLLVTGNKHSAGVFAKTISRDNLADGVIASPGGERDAYQAISSGFPGLDTKVVIVDPMSLEPCPDDRVGEIWVSSPSVASGYWGREADNEQIFRAMITGRRDTSFLRTGDLGFVANGQLYVTGRLKDMLIVGGRNYYPQDLEDAISGAHPVLAANAAAAFSLEEEDRTEVVLVTEVVRSCDKYNLVEAALSVRQAVADACGVQLTGLCFVAPGHMLKTSSGKVRRSACRAAYIDNRLMTVFIWRLPFAQDRTVPLLDDVRPAEDNGIGVEAVDANTIERLSHLLACILGIRPQDVQESGPSRTYILDSLGAVDLQYGIEEDFGAHVPLVTLLAGFTLAQLAVDVDLALAGMPFTAALPGDSAGGTTEQETLTPGQQAIWMFTHLHPMSSYYNLCGCARILDKAVVERLPSALTTMMARHPRLRSRFRRVGATVRTSISPSTDIEWEEVTLGSLDDAEFVRTLREEGSRLFDLTRGPLLRMKLFWRAGEPYLLVTVHHIVFDYWSASVFLRDLLDLFSEPMSQLKMGPISLDGPLMVGGVGAETACERLAHVEYWRKTLAEPLPVLNLPTASGRPTRPSLAGHSVSLTFDGDLTRRILTKCRQANVSEFTFLLTVYVNLLCELSGQRDLVVGVPTNGRKSARVADAIGYFVNVVPIRVRIDPTLSFQDLLGTMKLTVLDALSHDALPFSHLVQELHVPRDSSRHPVFQAMFAHFGSSRKVSADVASFILPARKPVTVADVLEPLPLGFDSALFDFTLMSAQVGDSYSVLARYNRDLFTEDQVQGWLMQYRTAVASALDLFASSPHTILTIPGQSHA